MLSKWCTESAFCVTILEGGQKVGQKVGQKGTTAGIPGEQRDAAWHMAAKGAFGGAVTSYDTSSEEAYPHTQ